MARRSLWRDLWLDERGTAVIEAAIVVPILGMLSLGAFDVSAMVARNTELQSALDETAAIALAHAPEDQAQVDAIEDIVEASTGLADADVTIGRKYRCGTAASLVDDEDTCASTSTVSSYLEITLTDSYVPRWVSFGIGAPFSIELARTVQIG